MVLLQHGLLFITKLVKNRVNKNNLTFNSTGNIVFFMSVANTILPAIVANTDITKNPTSLRVYIWLIYFCKDGSWKVNYKALSKLISINVKKLSLAIKALENLGLINIDRKTHKGRILVDINRLPDLFVKREESIFAELQFMDQSNLQLQPIKPEDILNSQY